VIDIQAVHVSKQYAVTSAKGSLQVWKQQLPGSRKPISMCGSYSVH
jgi:hypothetical protein